MPHFINNRGQTIVPSLEYLAMVNEGITKVGMMILLPDIQEKMKSVYQRLGGVDYRFGGQDTVYLEGDVTAKRVPWHKMKLDPFKSIYDSRNMPPEQKISKDSEIADWSTAKTKREDLRNMVLLNLPDINAIMCRNQRITDKDNFVHLRSGRGGKMTMEVTAESFRNLAAYGFNFTSVEEFQIFDYLPIFDVDLQFFLRKLPNLRSFVVQPRFDPHWGVLAQQRNTLRELQIICGVLCTNLAEALKNMPHLEMLSLGCAHDFEANVELHTLELSPSLRSLSLSIESPKLKANCIVNFLTRKVNNGGVMVAREFLLEDLTLLGMEKEEIALLYDSTALTQRMKDRIYSDFDIDCLTATVKVAATRNNFGLQHTKFLLVNRIHKLLRPYYSLRYRPQLMSVCLELFGNSPKENFVVQLYKVLHRLMPTYEIAVQFDRRVLQTVLDVIVNGQFQITAYVHDNKYCAPTMIILDECNVAPSNVSRYLECVLNLFICPRNTAMLATLFMKQVKTLTASELENFLHSYKNTYAHACLLFVYNRIFQWQKSIELSSEMIDMLNVALRSADKDLKIAANAVLRRCEGGRAAGSWCDDRTEVEEETLRVKLRCGTSDDTKLI